jgi:hypothetical protein
MTVSTEFGPGRPAIPVDLSGQPLDEMDAAAVAALAEVREPVGLWRTWLTDRPQRVYLLEAGGDGEPIRAALTAAGEPSARVDDASADPGARARSALLWAAAPVGPVTVARVFDAWTPEGGGQFDNDHPILSAGQEPQLVRDYLAAGQVLLSTDEREVDVFDPDGGEVVPLGFRTDGRFIWTDAIGYYLENYALSPDAELLAHLRAQDYRPPEVGAVAAHRALAALFDRA